MTLLDTIKSPADLKALPIERLTELAQDIRTAIIDQVRMTGGHLAPNLGVVELTIALHYVFDFAHDRLLFDVGHQCYPHKLLTGRAHLLGKLRTSEGMAGFPAPCESHYDLFAVGHAGTGVSTAVGMARGDTLNGQAFDPRTNPDGRRVVTLVGDASIVNGLSMEGLNNAGTLKRQMLVILNDNGMSISKPQGALAQYFDRVRLSHMYADFKKNAREILKHLPGGSVLADAYHRAGEATKAMIAQRVEAQEPGTANDSNWFEHLGLITVGPIDGHDLPQLIEFLAEARDFDRPMVLHVKTIKGKGLDYAEKDATTFHSPAAHTYDPDACRVEMNKEGRSFTSAIGDALVELMQNDEKIVACTAAMPGGTGMDKVMPKFPERTWDTGICESHALDMMAGMAKTGLKPFFCVYSTFLQRAFDQAFQEVALQGLAVRLCLDRAGLVGGDGAVHHGFCDIAILRTLPGACLLAPIDEPSLVASLEFMRDYEEGLSAVRYPRDNVSQRFAEQDCPPFQLGKARCLTPALDVLDGKKPDAIVLAFGTPAITALDSADTLAADGIRVAVYDARFAKPIDDDLVRAACNANVPVLTIEDHSVIGGFGTAVLESAQAQHVNTSNIHRLGIPDRWIMQDSRNKQLADIGLDANGISKAIRLAIEQHATTSTATLKVQTATTQTAHA